MIITLTTDWGLKDFYLPAVKGRILSMLPSVNIVDITHEIPRFDIIQASIILKNAFPYFPEGTVHIIGVNSIREPEVSHLAVAYRKQFFIGADNGIFSLVVDGDDKQIVELGGDDGRTFPALEVFARAACVLASGGELSSLGQARNNFWERVMARPSGDSAMIRGSVIYIDVFGNVITNISRSLFEEAGQGRPFTIYMKRHDNNVSVISNSYHEVPPGELVALFNSQGLLEIAIRQGNASGLLGLKFNDTIRIEFND